MKFEISSELGYDVRIPTTFIFSIQVSKSPNQTILEELLTIDPYIPVEEFISASGESRFFRLKADYQAHFSVSYKATVDVKHQMVNQLSSDNTTPVDELNTDIIPFLFPSRYCQSDRLQRLAFKEFGQIENPFARVLAICDWIFTNVEYLSGSTGTSTSAIDTLSERAGVCRDFAHLAIAICRALSIPARYFTGYAHNLTPPDFHACFEAYLEGKWIFFDPTRLAAVNGLVKIANGRDAADAAVASIYGNAAITHMNVSCQAMDPSFEPFLYQNGATQGLSYQ